MGFDELLSLIYINESEMYFPRVKEVDFNNVEKTPNFIHVAKDKTVWTVDYDSKYQVGCLTFIPVSAGELGDLNDYSHKKIHIKHRPEGLYLRRDVRWKGRSMQFRLAQLVDGIINESEKRMVTD